MDNEEDLDSLTGDEVMAKITEILLRRKRQEWLAQEEAIRLLKHDPVLGPPLLACAKQTLKIWRVALDDPESNGFVSEYFEVRRDLGRDPRADLVAIIDQWEHLLDQEPEVIAKTILIEGEEAVELRANSPFWEGVFPDQDDCDDPEPNSNLSGGILH